MTTPCGCVSLQSHPNAVMAVFCTLSSTEQLACIGTSCHDQVMLWVGAVPLMGCKRRSQFNSCVLCDTEGVASFLMCVCCPSWADVCRCQVVLRVGAFCQYIASSCTHVVNLMHCRPLCGSIISGVCTRCVLRRSWVLDMGRRWG
jgi:hypothetical protein